MLIKGSKLNTNQIAQVKAAFIYRWTFENTQREAVYRKLSGAPTMPLQHDSEWITAHAFHFINDGSRLAFNRHFAEPNYDKAEGNDNDLHSDVLEWKYIATRWPGHLQGRIAGRARSC